MKGEVRKPTFLVTRPEPDDAQTIDALRAFGFEAIASPVMKMQKLDFEIDDQLWQAVLATSRNGLRALSSEQINKLQHLPFHCVGNQTKLLAQELGFQQIGMAASDITSFVSRLSTYLRFGDGTLLYLAGKQRKSELEAFFKQTELRVEVVETYQMVPATELSLDAREKIASGGLDGVLLYSQRSTELLIDLLEKHDLSSQLQNVTFYCLSRQVAFPLHEKGYPLVVSDQPNADSLLACVKNDHNYLI